MGRLNSSYAFAGAGFVREQGQVPVNFNLEAAVADAGAHTHKGPL
jgi:hypothetical protein